MNKNISTDLTSGQVNSDSFVLYPNPTNGMLYIRSNSKELCITLYDLFGRNLGIVDYKRKDDQGTIQLNLVELNLETGIYLLGIKTGEKRCLQKLEYRKE